MPSLLSFALQMLCLDILLCLHVTLVDIQSIGDVSMLPYNIILTTELGAMSESRLRRGPSLRRERAYLLLGSCSTRCHSSRTNATVTLIESQQFPMVAIICVI